VGDAAVVLEDVKVGYALSSGNLLGNGENVREVLVGDVGQLLAMDWMGM